MGYLSRSVFQDRLRRIREALEEAGLAALVVLTPENFLYVSGHFLVNIVIPRLNGYGCENERTFFVGTPGKEQASAFEAAAEAQAAAAEAFVTGATAADVDAAAQQVFERRGFADKVIHRTGHGIGLAGHEHPDDIAFNYRPLVENEVWSCEPGIYLYGVGGFRHDDTVIVKQERAEITTKFPRDLESQTAPVKGGR